MSCFKECKQIKSIHWKFLNQCGRIKKILPFSYIYVVNRVDSTISFSSPNCKETLPITFSEVFVILIFAFTIL